MRDPRAAVEAVEDRLAADRFAEQLRALRAAVGDPSFRTMAGRSGRISHTTLHEAAAGTRFPSWNTTREFVRACEADEAQWRLRWEEARRSGTVHTHPDGDLAPANAEAASEAEATNTVVARTIGAESSGVLEAPAAPARILLGVIGSSTGDQGDRWGGAERPQVAEVTGVRRSRPPWLSAVAVVLVMATVVVLSLTLRDRSSRAGSVNPVASPSEFSDSLIPGDSAMFIADVTIPDGTHVKVNAKFLKVWALANVGNVDWHKRYLARTNPTADDDGCQVPDRVEIGDTAPGEQVMISVPVTAPSRPGTCWVGWKMVDENGQHFFPTRRPMFFMVIVTD